MQLNFLSREAFGEFHANYPIRVLNEREARAGAGLLFAFAMVSFLNAFLAGNFALTKLFVLVFFIDFFIRVLIHPRYAPSLILGRWFVRKQQPEYVGAPQKHFAWAIGLALGLAMLWLLVLNDIRGPINLLICGSCLLLLFFETAFGICLGCWMFHRLFKKAPQLCPGGVCLVAEREPIQHFSKTQGWVLVGFLALLVLLVNDYQRMKSGHSSAIGVSDTKPKKTQATTPEETNNPSDCIVPDWAIAMGHEDKYRRHHCGQ